MSRLPTRRPTRQDERGMTTSEYVVIPTPTTTELDLSYRTVTVA